MQTANTKKIEDKPKSNTKAHDQLGLTTQADKDAHDKKVAERIAALNAASSAPTRTDVSTGRTVGASSDVITVDLNECIRFKDEGNYGIVAGQHQQLNELFIEQALENKTNWCFKGDQCLVAISWSAIDDSLTDSEGNPYVLCEDRIWQRLPAKEKLRFSGRGNVGQPTQMPKLVYATYNQSFEGKTDQTKNPKKDGTPSKGSKKIGVYNIVIGDGDLTK